MAALTCLKYCVRDEDHVLIRTDSQYLIQCVTVWRWRWEVNGWRSGANRPVLNTDLIQELCRLVDERVGSVRFEHVQGHGTSHGNRMADELARMGALRLQQQLLEEQ